MIRASHWRRWAPLALVPLSMAALADDASGTLDQCIAKAVAARPGYVTGWQELTANPEDGYYVRIVTKDGAIGLTECRPTSTAPLEFSKKTGFVRSEMYERAKIAEPAARAVAPEVFKPPVRLTRMELSISIRGVPYYTYTLALPADHEATVEVDAVTGKPITAKVKY